MMNDCCSVLRAEKSESAGLTYRKEKVMKRVITTLLLVLVLVGYIGLTNSLAATSRTIKPICCEPAYADFIGAPGSCPTLASHGPNVPTWMPYFGW